MPINQPSVEHKLFSVAYDGKYSRDRWLVWCKKEPSRTQIVAALKIDFNADNRESIYIEEIKDILTFDFA
jgi:uncharacterized membrane protein